MFERIVPARCSAAKILEPHMFSIVRTSKMKKLALLALLLSLGFVGCAKKEPEGGMPAGTEATSGAPAETPAATEPAAS